MWEYNSKYVLVQIGLCRSRKDHFDLSRMYSRVIRYIGKWLFVYHVYV